MLTELKVPTYTAYFTVGVRVDDANRDTARAVEIVTRYLYDGAVVVSDGLDDDAETFLVLVRTEGYGTARDLAGRVQYQRDRLSSGLYASTAPIFLGHTAVDV